MSDKTKAEIHITVDGFKISVKSGGNAYAIVRGLAAAIHDLAIQAKVHPSVVTRDIIDYVKKMDDKMVTYDRKPIANETEDKPC